MLGPQVRGGHVRGRGREQRQGGALLRQDGGEEEGLKDDQRTGGRRHVVGRLDGQAINGQEMAEHFTVQSV